MRLLLVALTVVGVCAVGDSMAAVASYAETPLTDEQRALGVQSSPAVDAAVEPASFAAPPAPTPAPVDGVASPGQHLPTTAAFDPTIDYTHGYHPNGPNISLGCSSCSRWFAGIDVGATEVTFTTSGFAIVDSNVGASVRPYVGWESFDGHGFRVRSWFFGTESEAILATTHNQFDLDVAAVTVETDLYKRLDIHGNQVVIGAGPKVARTEFRFPDDSELRANGVGLSAFADLYDPLGSTEYSEWGWLVGARVSYLGGDVRFAGDDPLPEADTILTIGEAYMGIQYRRCFEWSDFIIRGQVERQHWDGNILPPIAFDTASLRIGWEW